MHGVEVTVISFARTADGGVATGSVSGSASTTGAGHRARRGRRRRGAGRLRGRGRRRPASRARAAADWDDAPGRDRHPRLRRVRPGARRGVRPGRGGRAGCSTASSTTSVTTTYLGSSTGLRLRHVQPTGHYGCTGKTADRRRSAWVGGATRDFADVDALALRRDARAAARLGRSGRSTCPAGRYDTILPPSVGGRPDDRRLLVRRRPDRPRGPVGLQPARRRHPDRRADRPARACTCSPTRPTPASECTPFVTAATSGNEESVFDNGSAAGAHRLDRATARSTSLIQTRHSAAMTEPARHAVRRQPGAGGRRRHRLDRGPRRRHRARPAAHLPVVHPRGRPAGAAAHRPDPRRRLPRRGRRDHRRGQQLPVQREPDRPAPPVQPRLGDRRRASAGSGATTTSHAPRRRRCGCPTSTCRASPRRTETTCNLSAPDRV